MAYEKHTWVSREIVTAEKLNHIEEGIYNAAPEQYIKNAELSNNNKTLTLTKQDNTTVVFTNSNPEAYIKSVSVAGDGKSVIFTDESDNTITFNITSLLAAKQDVISDLETIRSGAEAGATALQESDVIDGATSTATNKPVSARVAKELKDEIDNLKSIGRYLSDWNSTTGLPVTDPVEVPYTYKTGDYYIVTTVGEINYKPNGTVYTGIASTTTETGIVSSGDYYRFDGTNWILVVNTQKEVSFANIAGSPEDNTALKTMLDDKATIAYVGAAVEAAQAYIDSGLATKQDTLTAGENITIDENNVISAVGGGTEVEANPTSYPQDAPNLEAIKVGENYFKVPEGGSGLPEGGNNGDVLTKKIVKRQLDIEQDVEYSFKDTYTEEDLETFMTEDWYWGYSKGIFTEEATNEDFRELLVCNNAFDINVNDGSDTALYLNLDETDQYNTGVWAIKYIPKNKWPGISYWYLLTSGDPTGEFITEDGWYEVYLNHVTQKLDETPTISFNQLCFNSDNFIGNLNNVNDFKILLNNNWDLPDEVSIEWAQCIPDHSKAKNGQILKTVVTPETTKKLLKESYTYEELEAFYGDLGTGNCKGIYSENYYNFDVTCGYNSDESKYYMITYPIYDDENTLYYCCNRGEEFEDGWYDWEYNKIDYTPEFFLPDDLTEDDLEYISDVSEMDILLEDGGIIPEQRNIEWAGLSDDIADIGDMLVVKESEAEYNKEIIFKQNIPYSVLQNLGDTYGTGEIFYNDDYLAIWLQDRNTDSDTIYYLNVEYYADPSGNEKWYNYCPEKLAKLLNCPTGWSEDDTNRPVSTKNFKFKISEEDSFYNECPFEAIKDLLAGTATKYSFETPKLPDITYSEFIYICIHIPDKHGDSYDKLFEADSQMTWKEFINDESLNTIGLYIDDDSESDFYECVCFNITMDDGREYPFILRNNYSDDYIKGTDLVSIAEDYYLDYIII